MLDFSISESRFRSKNGKFIDINALPYIRADLPADLPACGRNSPCSSSSRLNTVRLPPEPKLKSAGAGEIQRRTGKRLDDQYFTQTLLPDYMAEHADQTADWDVVFDARGHLSEPHTGRVIPLGTIDVRQYLCETSSFVAVNPQVTVDGGDRFPTCGPGNRYGAVLFIEKEGFMPLFRAVRLAERYDVAIMSTKGLSVTASRLLADRLCSQSICPYHRSNARLSAIIDPDKRACISCPRRWRRP